MKPHLRRIAILAATLASVAACTSGGNTETTLSLEAECRQRAVDLVDDAQRYVDQFAQFAIADIPDDGFPNLADVEARLQAARLAAEEAGCTPNTFTGLLSVELDRLRGKGPVGRPLALALRGVDPETAPARNLTVGPSMDLIGVMFEAGPGSVITLLPGVYELDEPAVIERSMSLIGAATGETIIRSSAAGAAIYYSGTGVLGLDALTVEHVGSNPASVVVAVAGSIAVRRVRVMGGVVDASTGRDGHGLALAPTGPDASDQPRTATVTDSEFEGNDRIGIAVLGSVSSEITTSRIHDNGLCGVCFLEETAGLVSGNVIQRNQVGVGISGAASPSVVDNDIRDNLAVGVQIEDDARPVVEANRIIDNVEGGIEVIDRARPEVGDNEIRGHVRGVHSSGESGGEYRGNAIGGNQVGVLIVGSADPVLDRNRFEDNTAAAITVAEQAAGTIRNNTLADHDVGIQVGGTTTTLFADNTVVSDGGTGALLVEATEAILQGTILTGHDIGIQVGGDAAPTIDESTVTSEQGTGIAFAERAIGSASGNTVIGHDIAYRVTGDAAPAISGGVATGAAVAGVLYGGASAGSAADLVIEDTDVGLMMTERSRPDVTGIEVIRAASAGIIYRDQASGTASDNTLSQIGFAGIQIGDNANPTLSDNTISAPDVGLLYVGDSSGSATANSITGLVAIEVGDRAKPTISTNTIRSTGDVGVIFAGSSGGTLGRNTIQGAAQVGIQVVGSASPTISANRVSAGAIGMLFGEDARGRATENTISGVELGIQAADQAAPLVRGNVFSDIGSTSILFLGPVGGSIDDNTCPEGAGILIFAEAGPEIGDNDCEVAGF